MAGYTAIANLETGASVRGKLNTQFTELFGENAKAFVVAANAAAILAIPAEYCTAGKIVLQYDTGIFYQWDGDSWVVTDCALNNLGVNSIKFDTSPTVTMAEGTIAWDSTAGTLMIGMPGGNVNLQIGQEMVIRGQNADVDTHVNGTVVYISGATGANVQMARADANVEASAHSTIAIATEDIDASHHGYYTTFGLVHDVNTLGMTEGAPIYLSETAGEFTTTKPAAPAHAVELGYVVVASATVGQIFVRITTIPNLTELSDVDISGRATGDLPYWDGTAGTWKARPPQFGAVDAGNYSEFESDGTYKANGDATTWKDLIVAASNLRPGGSPPSFAVFSGGLYAFRFDDATTNELHGAVEMQHDHKEGSDLYFHVHWSPSTTNTGDVRWGLEYTIANPNTTFPATATQYAAVAGSGIVNRHQLNNVYQITGTGLTIGAVLVFRLFRDGTNGADTFAGNAFLHSIGVHYEADTLGSRQITTKENPA